MFTCPDCKKTVWIWQESGVANLRIHKKCQEKRLQLMLRSAQTLPEKKGVLAACKILEEAKVVCQ